MQVNNSRSIAANAALSGLVVFTVSSGCQTAPQWEQWGGPNRNFMVESPPLADTWPDGGPRKLWHRELGDGYSTIVADDGLLYTMYRVDEDEYTVAIDEATGETVWEHKNPSPFTPLMAQFGPGPHATPVVAGNRVFTIGTNAVMHCLDKRNGKVLWKHDLAGEYGAPVPGRGYGCSPICYKNTVIVGVDRVRGGGRDEGEDEGAAAPEREQPPAEQSLMAFDQRRGDVVWRSQDYPISYASPILINFETEEQLVFLMEREMMGVNPNNGSLLWHIPFEQEGANLATPYWNGKDLIFCSSAYDSGSRTVRLTKKEGKTVPEELWYSRKMRIQHGNVVQIGDNVYGSSGDFGPAFFVSVDINTGEVGWRTRGFKKSTCLLADGKLIILDEDGELTLATVTPEGLNVHSQCTIAERYAWAAPTLVGTKLYVRDRKHIMAFDLG